MGELVTKQLARLITENPDLPVRVCVSSDLYNGENENYDVGEIWWSMIGDEYRGKDCAHFKNCDYANCEEVLTDACKKGDIPYTREGFELGNYCEEEDAKLEEMYEGLPWKECIVVYVE